MAQHIGVRYLKSKWAAPAPGLGNGEMALESKETPDQTDLKAVLSLAEKAGLKKAILIGRNAVPNFQDFIWGGAIF